MERGGWVYILTNKTNKVLYIGVTSNIKSRIYEHKSNQYPDSFTSRYNVEKLVYFKGFHSIEEAIDIEKKLKGSSRAKK
jgi:putative endonuclease